MYHVIGLPCVYQFWKCWASNVLQFPWRNGIKKRLQWSHRNRHVPSHPQWFYLILSVVKHSLIWLYVLYVSMLQRKGYRIAVYLTIVMSCVWWSLAKVRFILFRHTFSLIMENLGFDYSEREKIQQWTISEATFWVLFFLIIIKDWKLSR